MPGIELLRSEVDIFQQFNLPTTFKNISYVLIAISVFILLLACINVGNLLFARTIERNKETAIRSALGASQWRLITQQMWEGLIITIIGGFSALLLVAWALNLVNINMQSMLGSELSFWYKWELDWPIIAVALGFMVFTIFSACFLPAFKAARQDFNAVLKDGTKGAEGKGAGRMSKMLVTFQIVLISAVTMFGSILSVKVNQLTDIDVGIDLTNLYYTEMELPHKLYPSKESRVSFYRTFNQKLAAQNEFEGSSVRFNFKRLRVAIDGVSYSKEKDKPKISVYGLIGSPEFMGPRLIQGRLFDLRDEESNQLVTVVSESFANKYWPNETALGKRIQISINDEPQWHNVVGVVSNISRTPLEKPHQYDEVFVSGLQYAAADALVFFKYRTNGTNAENVFFDTLKSVDSQLDVTNVEDYAHEVGVVVKMTGTIRDTIIGSGIFALLLAISGIYGLTSFAIAKKTHEIGVRRALGAKDSEIVKLFLKQGGWQVSIGLTIGIGFALLVFLAAGRFIALPSSAYIATVILVGVLLTTIILAAIIVPTKKATALEPSSALRYE
ncbi:FtsX-like permease family protein [Alteromonas sp. ASW11-130]|uniref:FtsX-like permease family protein n=1 Tax=Alteromonas sp. ASW11-130 TaxID=3015775 RepID=UPI002241F3EC|nr:FtsX-like permease family protein [Alteromonas sp. ASW11-130]MCW8090249.1 FtsX-like permease family protein [Alteromonas sp. ASW11-130]